MSSPSPTLIAFDGIRCIANGSPPDVALAVRRAMSAGAVGPLLVFDAHSSRAVELDLRGSDAEVVARLVPPGASEAPPSRGPGRPRLGVTAREVTLLPRHWDWLVAEPGGASAALRRLVEQAMRNGEAPQRARQSAEAVDRFMLAMAGDQPGYEEVSRAFWRGERERFAALIERWPPDLRDHLATLAARAWDARSEAG